MLEFILENGLENKLTLIPLSSNPSQRRISDMSVDIKYQVIQKIKSLT